MRQLSYWPYRLTIVATILLTIAAIAVGSQYLLSEFGIPYSSDAEMGVPSGEIPLPSFADLLIALAPILTLVISAFGTIAGVIFAWRGDRRHARELELRVTELEAKLAKDAS